MTTDTGAPSADLLSGIDVEGIESGKVFARSEIESIVRAVSWEVLPADERFLEAKRYDFRSPAWRELFPAGFPVIDIGLEGINVDFAFAADHIKHVQIPIRFELGHAKAGQTRGRGSQLHVVNDAFKQVYGVGVIPNPETRGRVIGVPTLWGQHLGEMDDPEGGSQKREWGWDIPRQRMPDGYVYTGPVRKIEGRQGGAAGGAGGSTVGTAQLSEEESDAAVAKALVGLETSDFMGHSQAVLKIQGLAGNWYDIASGSDTSTTVAKAAHAKGLIAAGTDGLIHSPDEAAETEAEEAETVATK